MDLVTSGSDLASALSETTAEVILHHHLQVYLLALSGVDTHIFISALYSSQAFQEYNNKQILEGEKEEEEKKKDLHLHSCNKQPPLY